MRTAVLSCHIFPTKLDALYWWLTRYSSTLEYPSDYNVPSIELLPDTEANLAIHQRSGYYPHGSGWRVRWKLIG